MHKKQAGAEGRQFVEKCVRAQSSSSGLLFSVPVLLVTVWADLLFLSSF